MTVAPVYGTGEYCEACGRKRALVSMTCLLWLMEGWSIYLCGGCARKVDTLDGEPVEVIERIRDGLQGSGATDVRVVRQE